MDMAWYLVEAHVLGGRPVSELATAHRVQWSGPGLAGLTRAILRPPTDT
jgi:hypothetical protein